MRDRVTRRRMLASSLCGVVGTGALGWRRALADGLAAENRQRHVVLLWMTGGPSQTDTFDMKPGHENGGEFSETQTNVAGLRFSEHLPRLARMAHELAVVRGLSTKEGDHGRGTYLMRTGRQPGGVVQYPTLGSLVSRELGDANADVPNYVSIAPYRVFNRAAFQPGFLGPRYAPLTVGAADSYQQARQRPQDDDYAQLTVDDLRPAETIDAARAVARTDLLRAFQRDFVATHHTAAPVAHQTVYERAIRMMQSEGARAFDLDEEPGKVRDRYGRGRFGQGCLMARRLIERGVPFVEVSLGGFGGGALGWDTHRNNFDIVKQLSQELDAGWSSLMEDLRDRGLLESTTIVWMGEFGRTPKINRGGGRDHYPKAWTSLLAGGGVAGGQAYGKTSADGTEVVENPIDVDRLLATLCRAAGIDPATQNVSSMGRPIRITDGEPIDELLV